MRVLDRLRSRSPRGNGADARSAETASTDEVHLPTPDYDRLDGKEVAGRLHELSQVDLAAVETYERSHKSRPAVLNKLRYMRSAEPLPSYDTLTSEEITNALGSADGETLRAVRLYERKFRNRRRVLQEVERARHTATPSAREDRAREENAERVRVGAAGRAETAARLNGRQGDGPRDDVTA
jgi:hypothetical protein